MEYSMLESYLLPTQAGLRAYSKQTFGEEFESDADCFIDTFQNGRFHEEYPDWSSIANGLSRDKIAELVLPICQALVGSHPFEGDKLDLTMNLYNRVGEWHRGALDGLDDLIKAIDAARPLVADWPEGTIIFKLLDYGIRQRAGLSTFAIESVYANLEAIR